MQLHEAGASHARIEAYYALGLSGFHMETHTHARCELMYVTAGECTIEAEGRPLRLRPRRFVFINAGVPHRLEVADGQRCAVLNLEFACAGRPPGTSLARLRQEDAAFGRFAGQGRPYQLLADGGKLGFALQDLIDVLERAPHDGAMLELLFGRVMLELARSADAGARPGGMPHVKRALAYIEANLPGPLTVATVAGEAGVHPAYLQALFKKHLGCGVMAHVSAQRMEHACFLLKNTRQSVTDIACALGYNSRQHFGYVFRRHCGQSPRQYRQLGGQAPPVATAGTHKNDALGREQGPKSAEGRR